MLKKRLKSLALLAILGTAYSAAIPSKAYAEMREIVSMREILPSINRDTVVVFDLDNTVMEPVQTLGSDQFFGYLLDRAKKGGLDDNSAREAALRQVSLVQPISRVRAVESFTPEIIRRLQWRGLPVIALTARPRAWAESTVRQLLSLGVDFAISPLAADERVAPGPGDTSSFFRGILFAKGDKGELLLSVLRHSGAQVHRVVFVDDKLSNVESVERALADGPYEHLTFRYGAADPRVRAFDPALADFEWRYFLSTRRFVSDDQAREMMGSRDAIDHQEMSGGVRVLGRGKSASLSL